MILDPWQQKFLETKGDKILCTGRQSGKSVICSQDAGEYSVLNANQTILMIAPTERQAYALFEKTLNYLLDKHPRMIKKGKDRPTQTKIYLTNGTKIYCVPTGIAGIGIRGFTINRLYVDEASRVPEDVWTAVTPMLLTTGGSMILLSTPAGKRGLFYECWENKGENYNSFARFSISSEEVVEQRTICDSWTQYQKDKAIEHLAREKERMTRCQYAQEYLGKFMDELKQFFPTELIKSCMIIPRNEGYTPPLSSGDEFLGVDVAGMGSDESVLLAVKRVNRDYIKMVDMEITTKTRTTETVLRIKEMDKKWHFRRIFIDNGGMGVGVFDSLLEDRQTRRRVVPINNAQKSLEASSDGRKTSIIKVDLYINLQKLMEMGKLKLFDDPEILLSLQSIQYEYDGECLKIFGSYTHITEALVRAAWSIKDKSLKPYIA